MNTDLEEFIEFTKYPKDVILNFLSKNHRTVKDLYCKCGEPKRLKRSVKQNWLSLDNYCGRRECNKMFGKLRPHHSEHMKNLAKNVGTPFADNLIKRGELRNPNINSNEFLRTKLKNKGYNLSGKSDEDIVLLNSSYESVKNISRPVLEKTISTYIDKYRWVELIECVGTKTICTLNAEEFNRLVFLWRSLYHEYFCSGNCGSKFFKRQIMQGFLYNTNNVESLLVKSSYEANFITFFESNKILWDYEPIRIKALYEGTYKPDFIFEYRNKKYMVEVKGFIRKENFEWYMRNKINAGYKYAKENDMEFVFTYNGNPNSIEDILIDVLTQEYCSDKN